MQFVILDVWECQDFSVWARSLGSLGEAVAKLHPGDVAGAGSPRKRRHGEFENMLHQLNDEIRIVPLHVMTDVTGG